MYKKLSLFVCLLAFLAGQGFAEAAPQPKLALKVGVVNFKKCVEQSNLGKQEQASFEAMKKQMESVLGEKDKALTDLDNKLNDPDYLDSLSPESETELRKKFRQQREELMGLQNQYMQTLQQANVKVIQKLSEMVGKSANALAKNEKLDIVLNEDTAFFYSPEIDFSDKVIAMLNADFEKLKAEDKNPVIPNLHP